jgi:hypothetical protein
MILSFQEQSLREVGTAALRHAFGGAYPVLIEAVGPYIRIALCVPADFAGDAEACLRAFDDTWLLKHCHRLTDTVYDYHCDI